MSEIAEKIAREHPDYTFGPTGPVCNGCRARIVVSRLDRVTPGWNKHVAEVTEKAVRAEVEPPHVPYGREPFDPNHLHDWADGVCNHSDCAAKVPATVTPSQEDRHAAIEAERIVHHALKRLVGRVDWADDDTAIGAQAARIVSAILALLPGRSEAEVRVDELRKATTELLAYHGDYKGAEVLSARADLIEKEADRG